MKYLILMYADESIDSKYSKEEFQDAAKTWAEFRQEMSASGILISSGGVPDVSNVTTVHVRNDKTMITDGPFAETHEQLGGYFVVDCKDLDEAIGWAEKIPTAQYGSIEIRALWSPKQEAG
jgi:hypothetical protein